MSRIGNQPIKIPAGVSVEIQNGGDFGHQQVVVTGPKGTLTESIRKPITIEVKDDEVLVVRPDNQKQNKSYHGLYRALIANTVKGVTEGFRKDLEIVGIGYRAEVAGENVVFSLGYAHKINFVPPQGITVKVQDQTQVSVEGISRQQVGEVAARIRAFREPEPYKGKGIRYKGEHILRKSVKQA